MPKAPNGGLHLSVLYRPAKRSALSSFVTMGACVAAARAIADASGRYPDIKWVNDLYRGGRKIAGILTEAGLGHGDPTADFIVVGIGVNLFRPTKGFPAAIAGRAGAVSDDAPPPSGDSPLKLRCSPRSSASSPPSGKPPEPKPISATTGRTPCLSASGSVCLAGTFRARARSADLTASAICFWPMPPPGTNHRIWRNFTDIDIKLSSRRGPPRLC